MEEESSEEPGRELNELQNADWVCVLLTPAGGLDQSQPHPSGTFLLLLPPPPPHPPLGSLLGSGDEGPAGGSQAEEGAGAAVQPAAHRVPAHPLRDADGRHPLQTLQAEKSHGQILISACFCDWKSAGINMANWEFQAGGSGNKNFNEGTQKGNGFKGFFDI